MIKCKDCKYSDKVAGVRYCKRYPPATINTNPAGAGIETKYPEVNNNDVCGDGIASE